MRLALAMRPPACANGTYSVRVIGRTCDTRSSRASSIEMMCGIGLKVASLTCPDRGRLFPRLLHEMTELGQDQFFDRQPHSGFPSGQRYDNVPGGNAGGPPAHQRDRTHLLVTANSQQCT